jgi:hypothetical protein
MLDPGGYSGTDWSTAEVIDMWLAISNQDTTSHWEVVEGWRKSSQLTDQHLQAVKNYRKNLIDAWPPEKSAASAAYVKRLDDLIDHLQQTFDAATANLDAFRSATLAIGDARTNLGKIVDEYYTNEAALRTFNESKSQRTPGQGNYKLPEPKPPVPDGRQEQLASQARSIMYGLGHELTTAQATIIEPPAYDPGLDRAGSEHKHAENTYGSPAVPPVVPFDPHSPSTWSVSANGGSHALPTHVIVDPNTSSPPTSSNPTQHPSLVLGGVQTQPVVATPGTISASPVPLPGNVGPVPGIVTPASPLPAGSLRLPGTPTAFSGPRRLNGEELSRPSTGPSGGRLRALPPGGVIGETPGTALGQPPVGRRPVQTVNPAGGVLNPGGLKPGRSGRSVNTRGSQLMKPYGRGDSEDPRIWDPDNPWETAKGVDPVVLPPTQQRVDPGPAIGLQR